MSKMELNYSLVTWTKDGKKYYNYISTNEDSKMSTVVFKEWFEKQPKFEDCFDIHNGVATPKAKVK